MFHLTTLVDKTNRNKTRNPFAHFGQRDFCFLLIALALVSCRPDLKKTTAEEFQRTITGEAQGTTWRITYFDLQERDFTPQVDSILDRIDESISTYQEGSVIDRWNKSDSGILVDDLFVEVLLEAWTAYSISDGAFDPTVKPLVSYWGFGPERFEHPETANQHQIDSLLQLVNFEALELVQNNRVMTLESLANGDSVEQGLFLPKPIPGMQLDFNAIGQGWSVDKVVEFLREKEMKVFFVEIGGEIVAGYPKPGGEMWRFGIDKPESNLEQRELEAVISLRNRGLATSGSYRKFYERNGTRYSHTINPYTGYPVQHGLLSATVVSGNAAEADAMATAFMVMGKDSTLRFLESKPYLSDYVYLIYDSANVLKTYSSPQIRSLIEDVN